MITASPAASSFTPGSFTYASQEMADAGFFNKGLGRSLAPPEKATQSMVHGLWSVVRSPWSVVRGHFIGRSRIPSATVLPL